MLTQCLLCVVINLNYILDKLIISHLPQKVYVHFL